MLDLKNPRTRHGLIRALADEIADAKIAKRTRAHIVSEYDTAHQEGYIDGLTKALAAVERWADNGTD